MLNKLKKKANNIEIQVSMLYWLYLSKHFICNISKQYFYFLLVKESAITEITQQEIKGKEVISDVPIPEGFFDDPILDAKVNCVYI